MAVALQDVLFLGVAFIGVVVTSGLADASKPNPNGNNTQTRTAKTKPPKNE